MKRYVLWLVVMILVLGLIGCGDAQATNNEESETPIVTKAPELTSTPIPTNTVVLTATNTPVPEATSTPLPTATSTPTPSPTPTPTPSPTPTPTLAEELGLSEQQMNSFSMLYYLAITAEEIRTSKDNRLILDDIYTSLLNDINPGSIDETTQDHLKNLRDIIKSYINISVKRERLQYIYNQNKAASMRSAVPNPLAILSVTNSFDWKKLVLSVAFTAVDSYNNYKTAENAAEQEFFMSGWELDDEETATIQKNRERAFDYMVDIVQEYDLDGKLTLSEKAIETFAEICAIEPVQQKIRRLESEEETYKLLGNYWLELTECYYETDKYEKCLSSIERYNELATGIYRKDYNYVQVLPKVIVATQNVYKGTEYEEMVGAFVNDIMKNTSTDEWAIRYFAAQVYLDLYARTEKQEYLDSAFNIAYDNVTILLDEQQELNSTYLADVEEVTITEPDYRFLSEDEKKEREKLYKAELKQLKVYNKSLKEKRETELPTLYEPLILNCELLFALAEEMNITASDKADIEAILQTKSGGVFLSQIINRRYSFNTNTENYSIEFNKSEVVVPVNLMTDASSVVIKVTDNNKTTTFDDCMVSEVVRDGKTIDTFFTHITSKQMKDYEWTENSKVTIEIHNGDNFETLTFRYKVKEYKDNWLIPDKVVFEEE